MSTDQGSSSDDTVGLYRCEGDSGSSTWVRWTLNHRSLFNGNIGDLQCRREGAAAIVRMEPNPGLGNLSRSLHGGAVMTFADIAMFIGCQSLGCVVDKGLTVDLNVQFVGAADLERPVDAIIEIARETGRLIFVRGTVEQAGDMIASFIGILRKPRP